MRASSIGIFVLLFAAQTFAGPVELGAPVAQNEIGAWRAAVTNPVECREMSGIPGGFLCLTQTRRQLRDLMGRVSYFVEGRPGGVVASPQDVSYLGSPQANYDGHDIMARDFERFFERLDRSCETDPSLCAGEYELALKTEVIDVARRRGYANYAIIAVGAGNPRFGMAASHEILHARFFLIPAYRQRVEMFWRTMLSEQDRALVRASISQMYNLAQPNGEELLINEFQAYVLMDFPEEGALGFVAGRLGPALREHMGPLLPAGR